MRNPKLVFWASLAGCALMSSYMIVSSIWIDQVSTKVDWKSVCGAVQGCESISAKDARYKDGSLKIGTK